MRIRGFHFLLLFVLFEFSAKSQTVRQRLEPLLKQRGMAEYFSGIFRHLGVHIEDAQEKFTVTHKGNSFELTDGINESAVDYTVQLQTENISNLLKHAEDGKIDEKESYRIMRVLFTPITHAGLNNPFLTKRKYLRAASVEHLLHVILLDPEGNENYHQTLVYSADQWIVVPGLHGKAQRIFKLTPQQALDYQRHLFAAKQENTREAWMGFSKWYGKWKETVSVEEKK